MSNIADIVKGINQAAANAHDGALDEDGEPVAIGLERNKPTPITDKRVMDGFGVTFLGNNMRVNYTSEVATANVKENKLKDNVETNIEEVVKFLKKEYKKITGDTLRLKKKGSLNLGDVQTTSRVRSWVQANCNYTIEGVDKNKEPKRGIDSAIRTFLELGNNAKKPENVSITPKANEK